MISGKSAVGFTPRRLFSQSLFVLAILHKMDGRGGEDHEELLGAWSMKLQQYFILLVP